MSQQPDHISRRLSLRPVPVTFREACQFIQQLHRHHKPPRGMKFAIGVSDGESLRGVATAGRPVARCYDDGFCIEVNRTCTDGCDNVNSCLYGAVSRAAKAMGYKRVITYTQEGESGASLRSAGFRLVKELPARKSWADSSGSSKVKRDPVGSGGVARLLWERIL